MGWNLYGSRGNTLEEIINFSNQQYRLKKKAVIQKISTPKTLKSENGEIIGGFYREKSTVDYIGCYNKYPIAFDAKETNLKNLPLKNIHQHQQDFLMEWQSQGNVAFYLVMFKTENRYFLLDAKQLEVFKNTNSRKSIPFEYFIANTIEVKQGQGILLDYLKGVDILVKQKIS